jgi:hypothetical protein
MSAYGLGLAQVKDLADYTPDAAPETTPETPATDGA